MDARKTYKTALVIIPPENLWPPIQAIRKRHDRAFRRWMPHITMVYPFRPKEEFHGLAADLSNLCRDFEPFTVELTQFRFFVHSKKNYTLWLAPEPESQLIDMQSALLQIVPDCNEVNLFPSGFTPHLSVGQVQGRAKMDALLQEFQQKWKPLSFTLREISLIWRGDPPDDVFQVAHRVALEGKGNS